MCTEVEVVAGVAPAERYPVGAHPSGTGVVADMTGQRHGAQVPRPGLDPRHVYSVAYYVQKFRDVGYKLDHAE